MKYKLINLPNGGKLAYVKNTISKTTNVELNFYCGARCDRIPGLAHFTEHMFFSGTENMTKDEISKKYFDFFNVNAFTTSTRIAFNGNVLTKEFKDYLSLVATMITESTFSQEAVDKEIKIVQQEITRDNDNYKRRARQFNDWNMAETLVDKYSVLGNKESVGSIKSKDVKSFVKKYFIANNLFAVVSSPLSVGQIKKLVIKHFESKLPIDKNFKQLPLFYGQTKNDLFYKVKNVDIDKNYIFINYNFDKTYLDYEFEEKASVVLCMMNDFAEGVKKYIRLKKSLVYSGGFSACSDDKSAALIFHTECEKANINELLKTVAEYMDEVKEKGFAQEQLDKIKREIKYSEDQKEPRVSRDFKRLYEFRKFNKVLDRKKLKQLRLNLTLDEANQIFRETLDNARVSLSIYGNATKKELISEKEFYKLYNKNRKS